MKKIRNVCFVVIGMMMISSRCGDDVNLKECYKGVVIGKFESSGHCVAVSLTTPAFGSENSRKVFGDTSYYQNVIGITNVPEPYNRIDSIIYFQTARKATADEIGITTADGTPAKSYITIINFNNRCNPTQQNNEK